MSKRRARLAVLISGAGTNLQALLDACGHDGGLSADVVVCVSNRARAGGLARAAAHGVQTDLCLWDRQTVARGDYDAALACGVASHAPDLVVLAGWMHVLSARFLDRFPGRVINLHPALPGAFAGVRAIERAHAAATRGELVTTGVMVHHVIEEVDAGPLVVCEEVSVAACDTLVDVKARMQEVEHRLIVEGVRAVIASLPDATHVTP